VDTGDLSDELLEYARRNQLDEAMQLMKSLSREERTAIAGRPDKDGRTALITVIEVNGSIAFVEFLVDECGADVDQHGVMNSKCEVV